MQPLIKSRLPDGSSNQTSWKVFARGAAL